LYDLNASYRFYVTTYRLDYTANKITGTMLDGSK